MRPGADETEETYAMDNESCSLEIGHMNSPLPQPSTTNGYIEADLKMKADCLRRLVETPAPKRRLAEPSSRVLAFLEAL